MTVTIDKGKVAFAKEDTYFGYIKGKAMWPQVLQPNKFGDFEVKLYPSDEDFDNYKSIAEGMCEEAKKEVEALGKKVNGIQEFIKEDDEGNEYIKFKYPEIGYEGKQNKIKIFNNAGDEDPDWDKLIGNGSILKVKYWLKPYYMAASKTVGVSIKFNAIQVIKHEVYEGKGKVGFGDETDGSAPFDTEGEDF